MAKYLYPLIFVVVGYSAPMEWVHHIHYKCIVVKRFCIKHYFQLYIPELMRGAYITGQTGETTKLATALMSIIYHVWRVTVITKI